jgi:hypothetical protein
MTPELRSALKRHMQWFGSYKKSGELVKVQVWLIVSKGRVEFLTNKNSYKVRRLSRNPKAISYVGSENGPAVAGTAQIITEKADLARVSGLLEDSPCIHVVGNRAAGLDRNVTRQSRSSATRSRWTEPVGWC